NGAGKSSLIKIIMGIMTASSGEVKLDHQPINTYSQKQRARKISYVPQVHNQNLNFSVEEFIKMGRYAHHSAFSDWNQDDNIAFERAINITQTEGFLKRHINSLSGGETQRVMIAAALCQYTPILLLDEPTSFLDPHHQVEVHHLIHTLNKQHGMSIIEVSHDFNHAAQHSQHILALKHGKRLWHGPAKDILDSDILYSLYDQHFVFTSHPETGAKIALASER
ncbi:MAG: ABC transporter ATP-binding protein, partial [Gammaproteobacteria bacterium]